MNILSQKTLPRFKSQVRYITKLVETSMEMKTCSKDGENLK